MKITLTLALMLVLGLGPTAGAAQGDGSPYAPGLVQGASGVLSPNGNMRYVALATARSTVVAAIRVRTGRVMQSTALRGFYGIPIVAWDNSTAGISGDGRTLVVGSYGPQPGTKGSTSFVVLDARTLRRIRRITLQGSWAFDAIAPDGSRMYLIEYLSAVNDPHYQVRSVDLETGRLDRNVIADRREDEVEMRGRPVTRKTSANGAWAYTLYARLRQAPFVHALDTVEGKAYCIDLPLPRNQLEQMALRLRLARGNTLEVLRDDGRVLAIVDLEKLEVQSA
jgi:hypothetical protein